jgi:hypothetical protein
MRTVNYISVKQASSLACSALIEFIIMPIGGR